MDGTGTSHDIYVPSLHSMDTSSSFPPPPPSSTTAAADYHGLYVQPEYEDDEEMDEWPQANVEAVPPRPPPPAAMVMGYHPQHHGSNYVYPEDLGHLV